MQKSIQSLKIILPIAGLYLILFIVGTIWDFPISQAVIDQSQNWAVFVSSLYTLPPHLIISLFGIIFYSFLVKTFKQNIVIIILGAILVTVFTFILFWSFTGDFLYALNNAYQNSNNELAVGLTKSYGKKPIYNAQIYIAILLTTVFLIGALLWLRKKDSRQLKKLLLIAFGGIALTVILNDGTTIAFIKNLFGRPRPYEVLGVPFSEETGMQFQAWYQLTPFSGHNSFPSGHSTQAWMAVYLFFFSIPENANKPRAISFVILSLSILFGLAMMASRMILGCHFLTDVIAASALTVSVSFFLGNYLNKPECTAQL